MADVTSEARLQVSVEGEDKVKSLASSFNELGKVASQTSKTMIADQSATAAGIAQASATVTTSMRELFDNLRSAVASADPGAVGDSVVAIGRQIGANVRSAFGVIGEAITSAFSSIGGVIGTVANTIVSAAGAIGGFAVRMVSLVSTVGIATLAIGALVGGIAALGGVLRLMSATLDWAKSFAAETANTVARMKRNRTDLETTETRFGAGLLLIGSTYETVANQIAKRFTDTRLQKGLMGDKGIFARWGITAKAIAEAEAKQGGKRLDPLDYVQRFARVRQGLEKQLAAAVKPTEKARLQKSLDRLADDTLKLFGPAVAKAIQIYDPTDIERELAAQRRASAVGPVSAPEKRWADVKAFNSVFNELGNTFANLRDRIADQVLPSITATLRAVTDKVQELGKPIADALAAIATKAWDAIAKVVGDLDVKSLTATIQSWTDSIKAIPLDTVTSGLTSVGQALISIATAAVNAAQALNSFIEFMQTVSTGAQSIYNIGAKLNAMMPSWMRATPAPVEATPGLTKLDDITREFQTAASVIMMYAAPAAVPSVGERFGGLPNTITDAGTVAAQSLTTAGAGTSLSLTAAGTSAAQSLAAGANSMAGIISAINWATFGAQMGSAFAASVAGLRVPLGPMPAAIAAGDGFTPSTGGDNPAPGGP